MELDQLPAVLRDRYPGLKQLRRAEGEAFVASVLIRVRNERKELPRFIESLRRQTIFPALEVIVLDSESTDGTLLALDGLNCTIYQIPHGEFSFGQSCNLLMALANSDVCFFFSGHVYIQSSIALEAILSDITMGQAGAGYFRQVPNEHCGASVYDRVFLAHAFPPDSLRKDGSLARFSNAASVLCRQAWRNLWFPDVIANEDALWALTFQSRRLGTIKYYGEYLVEHSHNESAEQVERRVFINAVGRNARWGQVARAAFKFPGMVFLILHRGATWRDAIGFSWAHVRAYFRCALLSGKDVSAQSRGSHEVA